MEVTSREVKRSNFTESKKLLSSDDEDSHSDNERTMLTQPTHDREHKVGVFVVILAIVGSIVGGGVVSMPYATLQTGIGFGLLINVYNYICGVYSWYLLLEAKNMSGLASFAQLGFYCFGRASIFIICAMIAVGSWGFPIVYFKIFGEASSSLLSHFDQLKGTFWSSKTFLQLALGIVLTFFAVKKQIAELKAAGFILLWGIFLFIIFLIVRLADGDGEDISNYHMWRIHTDMNLLANIPTLILSYGFQSAFFPAYNSLKHKNDRNGMKATFGAFTICFVSYLSITLVALFTYGDHIEENILTNIGESNDVFAIFLQIIFLVISAMHIPIVYYIGKENVLIIVDEIVRKSYSTGHGIRDSLAHVNTTPRVDFNEDNHSIYQTMNPWLYYSVSIGVYALIILLSIVVKSLVFLLGIIGSTGSTFTIYIAPAAFYLKWYKILEKSNAQSDMDTGKELPKSKLNYYLSWVFLVKGVVLLVVLNISTVYIAIKS